MNKKNIYLNNEYKTLSNLIEYQLDSIETQIDDFKKSFEIDDIEENIIYTNNVNNAIKVMTTDMIILIRALRDKIENE